MKQLPDWPEDGLESVPLCPLCRSPSRLLLYEELTDITFGVAPGRWTLYRCNQCEAAYLDPRPTLGSIGLAYAHYYTHATENSSEGRPKNPLARLLHGWVNDHFNALYGLTREPATWGGRWLIPLVPSFSAKSRAKMRHLTPPPPGGGRLLDVGFGNGGFLKIASEMGWCAEGIDFDAKAVEVAQARGLNVSCASVNELAARNESYDIITLSHVIEHVHDPVALLKDLYRLLKHDGRLWLETPNINSLGAIRFKEFWRGLEVPRHLVLFSPSSLRTSLADAGFKQIESHWHGMAVFSMYAESTAIANGTMAQGTNGPIIPSVAAVIDELREMRQPVKREFLTFSARK
jgi:2-polyprenyl-3-methyl-5-hydroxy-6-metoxy-1,4-benzoquinol methylase